MISEDFDWDAYLGLMSELVGMPVPERYREETVANLRLNRELAEPLLSFEVPEGVNIAPVFTP